MKEIDFLDQFNPYFAMSINQNALIATHFYHGLPKRHRQIRLKNIENTSGTKHLYPMPLHLGHEKMAAKGEMDWMRVAHRSTHIRQTPPL